MSDLTDTLQAASEQLSTLEQYVAALRQADDRGRQDVVAHWTRVASELGLARSRIEEATKLADTIVRRLSAQSATKSGD